MAKELTLQEPIDCGDDKTKVKITVKRPKTKTLKKLIALLGPDVVKALVEGTDSGKKLDKDALAEAIGQLASIEKLDEITGIFGDVLCLEPEEVDEIDPVDYPKIFEVLAGFFPGLGSGGEK